MAAASSRREWRSFYNRLLKDEERPDSIDRKKYGPYHTYRQLFVQIDRILKRYPQKVTPVQLGSSKGGEPIWLFRVDNSTESGGPPARFLVTSLIHSIEYIGVELALSLLERFTANMSQNPSLANREVSFIPILNPDGYLQVEKGLSNGSSRFHRLNRNRVDLNRNFGVFFSTKKRPLGGLLDFLYNPGIRPFSEPETSCYRAYLLENRFDYALSLHSFGGRFFYPYAGTRKHPKDEEWFRETCRAMIDLQPKIGFRKSQLGRSFPLFQARGTEMDFLYEVFGTRSITIEAYKRGVSLLNPATWMNPFALFNPKDPKTEIDNLMDSLFYFLSLNR